MAKHARSVPEAVEVPNLIRRITQPELMRGYK